MAKSLLTQAEENQCWQEYCQMLEQDASSSLEEMKREAAWASYWENVFSLLDRAAFSERQAAADAEAYSLK